MSRSRAPVAGLDIVTLARGYPPVLGAMLLVDGVLTVILGGDATVSLGEVVAYLLLPPLAMFLLTRLTGGRRPGAVALGVGVAGAAVLVAALFLLGDVHLVTLPGWALALFGVVLLGVAVVLMRRAAPAVAPPVPPLLNRDERASFSASDSAPAFDSPPGLYGSEAADYDVASAGSRAEASDYGAAPAGSRAEAADYGAASAGSRAEAADYGAAPGAYGAASGGYGAASGGSDRPAEFAWPPPRRDDESRPYSGTRAADDTVAGLPRVPVEPAAGPPEPDWPPRRGPLGARPSWDDRSTGSGAGDGADWSTGSGAGPATDRPVGGGSGSAWSDGPADREWPPSSSAGDWSSQRDSEPGRRSWFETDEAQPSESSGPSEPSGSTWQPGPPDSEWPPADRTYPSGGRRSRHPNQ